jgi:hypothetical protein
MGSRSNNSHFPVRRRWRPDCSARQLWYTQRCCCFMASTGAAPSTVKTRRCKAWVVLAPRCTVSTRSTRRLFGQADSPTVSPRSVFRGRCILLLIGNVLEGYGTFQFFSCENTRLLESHEDLYVRWHRIRAPMGWQVSCPTRPFSGDIIGQSCIFS